MSKLRERLYKEYELEQLEYDFMGYSFEYSKETKVILEIEEK